MENFGKFMTILLIMIISPIINGFVFMKLWLWFIVPIFNVPSLQLVQAIGIIFLISFIKATRSRDSEQKDFWEEFGRSISFIVLIAEFSLLSGWIVTLFL